MRLTVLYNNKLKNDGSKSYMKAVEKTIDDVEFLDLSTWDLEKSFERQRLKRTLITKYNKILAIEPISKLEKQVLKMFFNDMPELDIEGAYTNKLTITAEAILTELEEADLLKVAIINQSEKLGVSLAEELMLRSANVLSLNKKLKLDEIKSILTVYQPSCLITATGDEDFKLDVFSTFGIKKIIDLSNDTQEKDAIRKINTVEILRSRL